MLHQLESDKVHPVVDAITCVMRAGLDTGSPTENTLGSRRIDKQPSPRAGGRLLRLSLIPGVPGVRSRVVERFQVKMNIRARFLAVVLLAGLAVSVRAQTVVTVPVAAIVQETKKTTFKQTIKSDITTSVAGKLMPVLMQYNITSTHDYGTAESDGLIPVKVLGTVTNAVFTVNGKPSAAPKLPTLNTTMYYDQAGKVKKVTMPDVPQTVGTAQQTKDIAKLMGQFQPPTGQMEIDMPKTEDTECSVQGMIMRLQITYTPIAIDTVGGEQAVKMTIAGSGDFNLSQLGAQMGVKGPLSGTGHISYTGGMSVGLKTGEIIRQSIKQSVTMMMDNSGISTAVNAQSTMESYRSK